MLLSYAGWEPDPWVERLPRLLEPMGIASHRVSTGQEASHVIETVPIHVAVVDLGLPMHARSGTDQAGQAGHSGETEAGVRLLELLRRLDTQPPTVVIKRGRTSRDDRREIAAALRAGAFTVLDRPRESADLEAMLDVLGRVLKRHYADRWPGSG